MLLNNVMIKNNTPGTRGGPGCRDRTLAVKRRKIARKSTFFPVRFPEVGQNQKTEKKERENILQGLGVAHAAVTEGWPYKEEKKT